MCKYHLTLNHIFSRIDISLEEHFEWEYFKYWIGDDSEFHEIYKEVFSVLNDNTLTPLQIELVEQKGRNLENIIAKWISKNSTISFNCIREKVHIYIANQLKKEDIQAIIGPPC